MLFAGSNHDDDDGSLPFGVSCSWGRGGRLADRIICQRKIANRVKTVMMPSPHHVPQTHSRIHTCSSQWPSNSTPPVLTTATPSRTSRMIVTKKPVLSERKLNITWPRRYKSRAHSASGAGAGERRHDLVGDRAHQIVHTFRPTSLAVWRRGSAARTGLRRERKRLWHEVRVRLL